jgi:cysteine desulfurase
MILRNKIYLDNAATTSLEDEVLESMIPFMKDFYGNPSSIHSFGRKTKSAIENARKIVAGLIGCSPGEIFFTSGGTEADNMAIGQSIEVLGIKQVISSRLEHHAVLHTLEHYEKLGKIKVIFLENDQQGNLNLEELEGLIKGQEKTLVSLMHGNNEIGNLLDLDKVAQVCKEHGALFHSDTVQTMGHYPIHLQETVVDFIVGAAHKFHGPKGVGFLYINAHNKIKPMIHGGSQERNMRGGTENLYGIVGLAKALELAYAKQEEHQEYIKSLKKYFIEKLNEEIKNVSFNGHSGLIDKSLYTVLNVSLPPIAENDMVLFNLDIAGIACSGGSACSSGTDVGSHVLQALGKTNDRANVRFSFSRHNTKEEIDYTVEVLKSMYH